MNTLEMIREYGHEEVAFFNNEKAGYMPVFLLKLSIK